MKLLFLFAAFAFILTLILLLTAFLIGVSL